MAATGAALYMKSAALVTGFNIRCRLHHLLKRFATMAGYFAAFREAATIPTRGLWDFPLIDHTAQGSQTSQTFSLRTWLQRISL